MACADSEVLPQKRLTTRTPSVFPRHTVGNHDCEKPKTVLRAALLLTLSYSFSHSLCERGKVAGYASRWAGSFSSPFLLASIWLSGQCKVQVISWSQLWNRTKLGGSLNNSSLLLPWPRGPGSLWEVLSLVPHYATSEKCNLATPKLQTFVYFASIFKMTSLNFTYFCFHSLLFQGKLVGEPLWDSSASFCTSQGPLHDLQKIWKVKSKAWTLLRFQRVNVPFLQKVISIMQGWMLLVWRKYSENVVLLSQLYPSNFAKWNHQREVRVSEFLVNTPKMLW